MRKTACFVVDFFLVSHEFTFKIVVLSVDGPLFAKAADLIPTPQVFGRIIKRKLVTKQGSNFPFATYELYEYIRYHFI